MTKVAVYGSLRRGMGNHPIIRGSKYLGIAKVNGWKMYSLGAFPAIVEDDGDIIVEVYEVDEATFKRLDRLEGYPVFYDRKKVQTQHGECYIYYHHEKPSSSVVENGDWVTYKGE